MKKLTVIGHSSVRAQLMENLMALGAVQISGQEEKLSDDQWKTLVTSDSSDGAVARYDNWISNVSQALDAIEKFGKNKSSFFKVRKPVNLADFERMMGGKHQIEKEVEHVVSLANRLTANSASQNKMETGRLSLLPWQSYDAPLELHETKDTDLILGTLPATAEVDQLRRDLEEKMERTVFYLINSDSEQHYGAVICLKTERAEVDDLLKLYGFNKSQFGDLRGTAADRIADFEKQLVNLAAEKEETIKSISAEEGKKESFQYLHDSLVIKRNQTAIREKLLVTKESFYFEGWLPRAQAGKVETLLTEAGCYYLLRDPNKDEETPVLLLNGSFSGPFEAITRLYALPDSRGVDATPFFSLSYAIFFGMMLSDAAYGAILTIATFLITRKYKLEGMTGQLMRMFFYCGISTIFWGLMFGGIFGDMITVVAKTFFQADVVVPALWFNPMTDPMKLLIFALTLGGIHLFVGMGLNAYLSIRDGRPFDALFDVGLWYVLLIGLVLLLAGIAAPVGQWMSIIGAAGILITGGRHKKGLGKITGGLGSLYGITGYLSDVLSYSRLLALGLATGVIASVVNTMGSLAGGGIMGLILFIIAFVVGHGYNIAINALGSFVHSCRLQYVEFFGKFYESGGESFEPFKENTKYIEIIREEN